jgi:hypothetical protein
MARSWAGVLPPAAAGTLLAKQKHVVLIARQCGACGKAHGAALRPLLQAQEMRVFSELVMDTATLRSYCKTKGRPLREM